ncbi:MAG: hypothetical protein U0790_23700 [Isosphaeraceae bacterium]
MHRASSWTRWSPPWSRGRGWSWWTGPPASGGHAAALARRVAPGGRVIGLDRDREMLGLAKSATAGLPVTLVHAPVQ